MKDISARLIKKIYYILDFLYLKKLNYNMQIGKTKQIKQFYYRAKNLIH